jgi:hypothetical protein
MNSLAENSVLYIYADGPRENATNEQLNRINHVREIIREKKWCKEVIIIKNTNNGGLDNSVVAAVSEVINRYGKIIVLEDDLVLSKGFLKYMNDALNLYESEEKVMNVSGYIPPVKESHLKETFFIKAGTSSWGWGTWKRAWKHFRREPEKLYQEITSLGKISEFNFEGSIDYFELLRSQINSPMIVWDICWYASVFLNEGYGLWPGKSLVRNIGHDNSGIHCTDGWWNNLYRKQQLSENNIVKKIEIKESADAKKAVRSFYLYLSNPPLAVRIREKIKMKFSYK